MKQKPKRLLPPDTKIICRFLTSKVKQLKKCDFRLIIINELNIILWIKNEPTKLHKKIIAIHKKSDLKKKFSKLLQLKKDHF